MLYDKELPSLKDKIIQDAEQEEKLIKKRGTSRASKVKIKKIKKEKKYENKK